MDHWYCRECRTARPEEQMLRGWTGLWCPNCVWDEVERVSAAAVGAMHSSGAPVNHPGHIPVAHAASTSPVARGRFSAVHRETRSRERAAGTLAATARRREVAVLAQAAATSARSSAQQRRGAQAEGGSEDVEEA